ncbi:hypothetical protein J3R82DRAFT_11576 [Butyriboletus roseoflavus]|nr:hypothetical protein J3R82DRAFT_11576 [Butyriboletus roseoflavus]
MRYPLRINSTIRVEPINEAINSSNVVALLQPYDIVLDCTDNVPTRYKSVRHRRSTQETTGWWSGPKIRGSALYPQPRRVGTPVTAPRVPISSQLPDMNVSEICNDNRVIGIIVDYQDPRRSA